MIRCLVTDRRRLCGAEASPGDIRAALVDQARRAAAIGVDFVQIRERDLPAVDLAAIVSAVLDGTRGSDTRVLVNDRLDVALACGAAGVQLRADSVPVSAARRIAPPPFVIGRSVHSASEIADATGADFLIAGTVFPTTSKPGARLLGIEGLRSIVAAARIPVLAIGGITPDRVDDVLQTGAAGIAAIGMFIDTMRSAS